MEVACSTYLCSRGVNVRERSCKLVILIVRCVRAASRRWVAGCCLGAERRKDLVVHVTASCCVVVSNVGSFNGAALARVPETADGQVCERRSNRSVSLFVTFGVPSAIFGWGLLGLLVRGQRRFWNAVSSTRQRRLLNRRRTSTVSRVHTCS